jgi:ABC-type nitrate/sulfonate/bicarbonate transport system permease component
VGGRAGPALVLVTVIVVSWELGCRFLAVDPLTLPAPSRIMNALWDARTVAVGHALTTLGETVVGFSVSVVFAVVAALTMDSMGSVRRAVYPLLVASQTVPIVAVAPLLVLWFGIGLLPKVVVVVLVTFFPIAVALLDGLASADRDAMDLLESMGASHRQQLLKLRLPGALPSFFTGLRISVTYAVIGARDLDRAVEEPVPDGPRVRSDSRNRRTHPRALAACRGRRAPGYPVAPRGTPGPKLRRTPASWRVRRESVSRS